MPLPQRAVMVIALLLASVGDVRRADRPHRAAADQPDAGVHRRPGTRRSSSDDLSAAGVGCRAAAMPRGARDAAAAPQIVVHHGRPLAVQGVDVAALVALARAAGGVIEVLVAVGDTVVESTPRRCACSARARRSTSVLLRTGRRARRRSGRSSRIRSTRSACWWTSRSARCRRRSTIRRPPCRRSIRSAICCCASAAGGSRSAASAIAPGACGLIVPFPTWDDFLRLAFGEICAYGATSVQVMRRMNALISDLDRRRAARAASPRSRTGRRSLRRSVAAHFADADERRAALDRRSAGARRLGPPERARGSRRSSRPPSVSRAAARAPRRRARRGASRNSTSTTRRPAHVRPRLPSHRHVRA